MRRAPKVKPKVWTTASKGVQPVFGITMGQKIHRLPPHPNARAEIKLLGAPKSRWNKLLGAPKSRWKWHPKPLKHVAL